MFNYYVHTVLILTLFLHYSTGFETEFKSDPSAIEGVVLMQTSVSWDGEPIRYPEGEAEVTAVHITIPAGEETGRHFHPFPSFAYLIEGSLEVTLENGSTIQLEQGEPLAEVTNTIHSGINPGETPARLIVFYIGNKDDVLTVMEDDTDIGAH